MEESQKSNWEQVKERFCLDENWMKNIASSLFLVSSHHLFDHSSPSSFSSSSSSYRFEPYLVDCTWNQTRHVKGTLEWNVERTGKCRTSLHSGECCFTDIVRATKSEYSFHLHKKIKSKTLDEKLLRFIARRNENKMNGH